MKTGLIVVDVILAVREGDEIGLEEEGASSQAKIEGCTFWRAGTHFYNTLEMFVIVTPIYSPKGFRTVVRLKLFLFKFKGWGG